MIKTYRKTATVKAIQWKGNNYEEIKEFTNGDVYGNRLNNCRIEYYIKTLEGNMTTNIGDYICKGIEGEFWPVKKEIFEKTYEEVKEIPANKNFPIKYNNKEYWISRHLAVAVFIFTELNGDRYVLATKRSKNTPDYQGYWVCPCGYLDFNEALEEAAVRETFEETGIVLNKHELDMFYIESNAKENNQNVTCRYKTTIDYIEPPILQNDECDEIKWIKREEIDNYEWAFNHDNIIKGIWRIK